MESLLEDKEITKFKETGLTDQEVEQSRQKCGFNKLEAKKKVHPVVRFLKQLVDPMVILLMVAGLISIILAIIDGVGVGGHAPAKGADLVVSIIEPIIIFAIVFANAGFGMWQEGKANKEMEALQQLTSPQSKVIRNSELQIIDSKDVAVGDILFLEAGDQITADARLIESFNLEVNESILTGESALVKKQYDNTKSNLDITKFVLENKNEKDIIHKQDMIFSGTSVINGSAKAIVTGIGENTQMGKIAQLIKNENDNLTPFQKQVHKLSKWIGYVAIIISIITFFINIVLKSNGGFNIGEYWGDSLEVSIALAIASIPEGMLAIIMVVLASAVKRMSVKKALIKRLPSVETLGSASIICSDKTGTLTQNKMTVVKMWNTSIDTIVDDKSQNKDLLIYGTLCTNGTVSVDESGTVELVGDPTETSIVQAALDINYSKAILNKQYKRLLELPFDSERKMMTVIVEDLTTKQKLIITKGAPDQVFAVCNLESKNNIAKATELNAQMSSKALRVLAVAIRKIDSIPVDISNTNIEKELTLIGLIGIIDPPREEVKLSIKECKQAGIRPIMITGDYKNTAVAIAEELGIMKENTTAISGAELAAMSDEDLQKNVENYSVYARVTPVDKIRIVKAWQLKDKIVSMTGDGVNDAPSLKAADIGCAMGITGTDVSKQAADVILTDDNFSTIVEAVKEGRKVMKNIKNVLIILLATCFSSLLTIFIGMILYGGNYFSPLQILWSNVIAETVPGIALGLNNVDTDVMKFQPRPKNQNIVDWKTLIKIITLVFFITVFSLIAFYIGISASMQNVNVLNLNDKTINLKEIYDNAWNIGYIRSHLGVWTSNLPQLISAGSALSFLTLTLCLSANVLSLRTDKSIFVENIKSQRYVIYSFLGSSATIWFVAYVPYVNKAFNMETYRYNDITIGYGNLSWINILPYLFVIAMIGVNEIVKVIFNKYLKEKINQPIMINQQSA